MFGFIRRVLSRRRLAVASAALALTVPLALTACDQSVTTSAGCAFVVGNGQDGQDANLRDILYPNQQISDHGTTNTTYVPCNSRNYIINDGSVKGAGNTSVGDRGTPSLAYTKDGTPIYVWTTTAWTLNESKDAMTNFYALCLKYNCASTSDSSGDVNFSTPGWNGMLAENFGSTIDRLALTSASSVGDDIWKNHSTKDYDDLGKAMSAGFKDAIRTKIGYSQDLFCGSGNSAWTNTDPEKAGQPGNTFTCSAVRITVDRVEIANTGGNDTRSQVVLNNQRLTNARALYGSQAEFWLGVQDSIKQCQQQKVACNIYVGNPPTATK